MEEVFGVFFGEVALFCSFFFQSSRVGWLFSLNFCWGTFFVYKNRGGGIQATLTCWRKKIVLNGWGAETIK